MFRLSLHPLLEALLSGTPMQDFGQLLSGLSAKAVADTIRQDEGEYCTDDYSSPEDVLTDAYLMSGKNLEDF